MGSLLNAPGTPLTPMNTSAPFDYLIQASLKVLGVARGRYLLLELVHPVLPSSVYDALAVKHVEVLEACEVKELCDADAGRPGSQKDYL